MANDVIVDGERIQGKVAGILTERELTINIGSSNGVREGMKFKVLANEPIAVVDPVTCAKLGEIDREKVRVITTEVQEKFSICKTYQKRVTPGSAWFNVLAGLPQMGPSREVPETLKAKDSSLPPPLSEEESYVKIGDRVIQLGKSETDDE